MKLLRVVKSRRLVHEDIAAASCVPFEASADFALVLWSARRAVEDQVLPRDIGGAGAGQPGNGGGDLAGVPLRPRGWPALGYALAGFGSRLLSSRGDGVDGDSVPGGVDGGGAGEACFGGGVTGVGRIAITGPVTLATMMIRPQPRLVMAGSAALVTRKAPRSSLTLSWTRAVVALIITAAPRSASSRAVAKPMRPGLPAPVIIATRPDRSNAAGMGIARS